MAKTEQKPKLSKQTKQMYVLGGLLGFLALVAAYNFLGSSKPKPPAKPAAAQSGAPAGTQTAGTSSTAKPGAASGYGPIEVLPIAYTTGGGDVTPLRNVFDYPPPVIPPPPPLKPKVTPVPPTINIGSVTPAQTIAGTRKPIPIVVTGSIFPGDAELLVNGQRVASQRVNGTILKATLPPSAIASPGTLSLEVKSASQPEKLWSGKITFTLTPSPDPGETFVYTGRLGPQAVIAFKDATKRPKLVTVGETLNGSVPWKVLGVNDKAVELLDTRNEIRKSLALVDKTH